MIIFGRKIRNELRARERDVENEWEDWTEESDSESEKCHFRCAHNVDQCV